ncbi:MAG: hypothetical protein NTY72_04255, partial [Bacteroidetes bacterium]|nr:hypothetical protein [Bacteroidota bacterium]
MSCPLVMMAKAFPVNGVFKKAEFADLLLLEASDKVLISFLLNKVNSAVEPILILLGARLKILRALLVN